MVHLNTQRLKELCHILLLTLTLEERLYCLQKILSSLYLFLLTVFHQSRGNLSGVLHLSVEIEDISQTFLFVGVYDICGCHSCTLVHSHIQRSVEAERETSCLIVKVM